MFLAEFHAPDGLRLYYYGSQGSAAAPRARVILGQGLGDHCRSLPYRNLANFLGTHQWAVCGFDLRGHGQSEGLRMFANTWEELRNDLHAFVDLVQRAAPGGPLFLIGLSLGGLLALDYALHHPDGLGGVVAAAPAVDASGVPRLIRWVMPLLSRIAPRASIDPGLDLAHISRDGASANEYTRDALFQIKTTPRLAAETLKAMAATGAQASHLRLPVLILHGEADSIVPPAGSAAFYEQMPGPDKERLTYPGAYHNLFIELNRNQVFADIVRWLERCL
jgi:alpha-beta hydrolase superfamily lysophospholipase